MGWYEWIVTALVVLLAGYSLSHYAASLLFIGGRRAARVFREHPDEALAVLIPARNEGAGTLAAVRSVLDQDHRGQIDVYVLLRDAADNALPHLTAAFDWCRPLPGAAAWPPAPTAADELGVLYRESHARAIIELAHGPRRSVRVALCGQDAKSAKLNWLLGWLARRPAGAPQPPPWVALLDADHRAHPAWLRSSLCLLREKGARFIQARRGALAASGLFALWDSLHQHVGCELFNTALRRLGLNVCFTGTTAVVATDLLHRHGLRACITEDTDLSYRVLLSGERIVYNPFAGSDEEVSPDLYSFLARRRR